MTGRPGMPAPNAAGAGGGVPGTAPEAVTAGFERLPDGPAVLAPAVRLDRAGLDTASLRAAARLIEAGIEPAAACVVLAPLDADGVVAYLGAVRAGAAVVGLAPGLPVSYVREVVERTKAGVAVVTGASVPLARAAGLRPVEVDVTRDAADPWPPSARLDAARRLPLPRRRDVASISFTSGSTGRPKALAATHAHERPDVPGPSTDAGRSAEGQLTMMLSPFGPIGARRRVLETAEDGSVLCPFDVRSLGVERLLAFLDEHEVRVLRPPVGLFRVLTATLGQRRLRSVVEVHLTGEALRPADLEAFRRCFPPDAELVCRYGSSETTIGRGGGGGMASLRLRGRDPVPDGPIVYPLLGAGLRVTVERADGTPAAELEVGEIVCRGPHLIEGYFDDPELTAQRFFADADGTRGYRTGDLGRVHPGGGLEVLGRVDDQVTVRGQNVHLGTVEAALRLVPGVRDGAVVAIPGRPAGTRLAAVLVVDHEDAPTTDQVRRGLARALPAHAVPQRYAVVPSLPRLPNGKLDRSATARVLDGAEPLGRDRPWRAPVSATERRLASAFADVLGVDTVGLDDDFFDLGGDSLAAEELVARLAGEFGRRVTRGAVLECPTVAALAMRVDGMASAGDGLVLLHPGGTGEPVFVVGGAGLQAYELVRLAHRLGADRPVYSYRSVLYDRRGRPDRTVEAAATRFLDCATRRLGRPPRLLAGYSSGAAIALEMAGRLEAAGEEVRLFVSIDGGSPSGRPRRVRPWRQGPPVAVVRARIRALSPGRRPLAVAMALTRLPRVWLIYRTVGLVRRDHAHQERLLVQTSRMAAARYGGRPFAGPALLAVSDDDSAGRRDSQAWARWLHGRVTEVPVPGDHHSLLQEPHVAVLADHLAAALRAADAGSEPPPATARN